MGGALRFVLGEAGRLGLEEVLAQENAERARIFGPHSRFGAPIRLEDIPRYLGRQESGRK